MPGERVGEALLDRRLVLANGVAVEEVQAVEVGQEVSLEERAHQLAHALLGNLELEPRVAARLALRDADRVRRVAAGSWLSSIEATRGMTVGRAVRVRPRGRGRARRA